MVMTMMIDHHHGGDADDDDGNDEETTARGGERGVVFAPSKGDRFRRSGWCDGCGGNNRNQQYK